MELVSFVLLHATMFRRDGNMCFFLALHIVLPYLSLYFVIPFSLVLAF